MELIKKITTLLSDKLAENIVVIDMRKHISIVDYFIICSVKSERQCRAVSWYIKEELSKIGIEPQGIEGEQAGTWIVMDYGDVVLHIFLDAVRVYYDIESLWSDAKRAIIE